ncbi:MAG: hypothetical protein PHT16_01465 [Candidatus Pacebacteria bacterium]|nr:hypothetical protein [Candidatus Paceibacterota bacterium]
MKKVSLTEKLQKRIWRDAKDAAGPRYTSDINVELEIKDVFDGIGRTEKIFEEIEEFRKKIRSAYKSISHLKTSEYKDDVIKKNLKKIQALGKFFLVTTEKFGKDQSRMIDLKSIILATKKISPYFSPIERSIWDFERKEDDEQREKAKTENRQYFGHSQSDELRKLKSLEHNLREFSRGIREIDYFAKSHKAQLLNNPFLLILGQAGMGKTHLVCDITKNRLENELPPTVIVLGEKLLDIQDSLGAIFSAVSIKGSKKKILNELNERGKKANRRALIIVDAINEADRRGWKSGVYKLIHEVKNYHWVGLVMTCRVPFQFLYLPKKLKIITEYHQGFQDNELEAMTAFFNFYGLSLPQVPLLISEFSSPLFLSCFCRTARDIKGGKAKVVKGINDLALGQVGMTKILEDFYISKEEWIVKKHTSKFKILIKQSWIWHKSGDCLIKNIAKVMAINGQQYLKENEVLQVIKDLSNNKYSFITCSKVLKILIEEGVLIRDAAWDDQTKKYFDVFKFSFHKFSDHIIARYLLGGFFDSKKITASLHASNSLGNLFSSEESILRNIGLIEALMVEFPERIKKNPKLTESDLIDYIPETLKADSQIMSAFIESLYWRKPENFLNTKGLIKKSIVDYINKTLLRYENSSREFLNLFVATATKPFHPFNSKMLNKYLLKFSLTDRDLIWSEYVRKQYGSGSIYKLISWIENQTLEKITADQAASVITVLSWALGTNVKLLRNRATRCLYIVGKIHPEEFFKSLQEIIHINDPYIRERILSVGYGIAMAIEDLDKKLISKVLFPNAKTIYALFFKKGAKLGSTNVLIRDYVRGIIEVALYHNEKLLSPAQIRRVRPPYTDGGTRKWGRNLDKDEGKYRDGNSPLGWEFEKDTLRHLVGSQAYDDKDKNYIRLKENMMWRLYQLGYSLEKFGEIDKEIVRNTRYDGPQNYAGKIERYGEKYSLIAYHEMLGIKLDKKKLDRWWYTEDGRNSEFEVDASFPQTPKRNKLFSKDLTSGPTDIKKWMVQKNPPDISNYLEIDKIDGLPGPWILVDGIIGEKNTNKSRKVTTFIYGILVNEVNEKKIEEFMAKTPFPGNDNIPSLPETREVFAGELGWREKNTPDPNLYIKIKRGEIQKKLTEKEKRFHSIRFAFFGEKEVVQKKQSLPEFKTETIYEEIPIQRLARWFVSKDYTYIKDNDTTGLHLLSKKIVKKYKLHCAPASFNILNAKREVVAIPVSVGNQYGTHENLLYARKDLVDLILKESGKKMLIVTWGERQYWPENLDDIHRTDHRSIIEKRENIYKQNYSYPFKK